MSGSKPKTKTRRARGEGTYEQLPSGLWRNIVTSQGRRIAGEAQPTKALARQKTLQKIADEKSGRDQASGKSFSTLAHSWLKAREKRYSPTTVEIYGYWIGSLEKDAIGKMPVGQITDRHLRAWKDSKHDWASATLRNRCAWLNQILAYAGSDARCPVPPKKKHARRPLSPPERTALEDSLAKADANTLMGALLCWKVGLRRSEACGLRHDDADRGGVWIRRVVLITKGKIIVRHKGKTEDSLVWVPLPSDLVDFVGSGTGFVISPDGGKNPMNPKVLYNDLKRCVGASLKHVPHMGLHALRRTYGMTLMETGSEVVTAAQAMRHDPQMLLGEYLRSREDLLRDAVKRAFPEAKRPPEHPREGGLG